MDALIQLLSCFWICAPCRNNCTNFVKLIVFTLHQDKLDEPYYLHTVFRNAWSNWPAGCLVSDFHTKRFRLKAFVMFVLQKFHLNRGTKSTPFGIPACSTAKYKVSLQLASLLRTNSYSALENRAGVVVVSLQIFCNVNAKCASGNTCVRSQHPS